MTPDDFVAEIRRAVIEGNVALYRDLFDSAEDTRVTDAYWKRALALYRSLDEAGRLVFFEVLRQVSVDTVSSIFGVLDGSSSLGTQRQEFVLTSLPEMRKLNGELQDLFLEMED